MPKKILTTEKLDSPLGADDWHTPDVVYGTPMKMQRRNVAVGIAVGVVVIAFGVIGASFVLNTFQPSIQVPNLSVIINKKSTSSATQATPSVEKSETTN